MAVSKFSVPLLMLRKPSFVKVTGPRVKVPPLTWVVPTFEYAVGLMVKLAFD